MKNLLIAAVAATGSLAAIPAVAQTSVTTTTTSPATTGSITIAPEQRTVIRQKLGSTKPVTIQEKVTVGATVPQTVELQPVPETIVSDIPSVKGYRYFVSEGHVVLVEPQSRRVVTVIE